MLRVVMSNERDTGHEATVTGRDLAMLQWIARCRFAAADQIAARFEIHSTKCYRRIKPMIQADLVKRERLLHNQPGAIHITRKGMRTIGISADMPVPTISLQSFLHDYAVVWEQINLERKECEVLTEREMRHLARAGDGDYQVRIPATHQDNSATHMPDLAFRIGSDWRALEVELNAKSESRLRAILTGYLVNDLYASVVYCVPNTDAVKRVKNVGDAVGLGKRLRVVLTSEHAAA